MCCQALQLAALPQQRPQVVDAALQPLTVFRFLLQRRLLPQQRHALRTVCICITLLSGTVYHIRREKTSVFQISFSYNVRRFRVQ